MMDWLKGFLKKDEKEILSIPLRIWSFISATWVWSLISLTWFWLLVLFTWLIGWLVIIPYIADELKKDVDRIPLTIGVIGALFIGTVGLLGLYVNYRRTVAFEEQLEIQRAQLKDQRELDKERRHQELYVASIRDLSDVGSIYGLEQLAKESEIWAPKIATIFCKYIRSTTSKADYREEENYRDKPSVEVSTMMEVLTAPNDNPFDSTEFDLRYSYLVGVNILGAKLKGANMFGINLAGAILDGADLRAANLTCADLNVARLNGANLEFALLGGTRMIKTKLRGANLSFTDITSGASERDIRSQSSMIGADLKSANLTGADLDVELTGAEMNGAILIGAFLGISDLRGADLKNVRMEGCEGGLQSGDKNIQPMEMLKHKIDQNTNLDYVVVGTAPIPNPAAPQNISRGYPKLGSLGHQTPEDVEEKLIDNVLISINGRPTDLSGVSCGALTQGLYDAIIKDRDSNTMENEKRYRDQNSKELKPGDPDMQKMQMQLVGNNVGQCKWDNLYIWK